MAFEHYRYSGQKRLRCGYTTGSCAAAAAKAAAVMLTGGPEPNVVEIETPSGMRLRLAVEDVHLGNGWAACAVRKDAGDDADVTDGILVYARVELCAGAQIIIDGGKGVGRVTRAGLDQPVGAAAINRVPRKMIEQHVREVFAQRKIYSGARVTISVPQGQAVAEKTFNPRLGIVGGISVLGTTGIVEPMSERALIDSIGVELSMLRAQNDAPILVTPGNYGKEFARERLGVPPERAILSSNFIGDTLDCVVRLNFSGVLLVGHAGKLIKLAGGIFNTHSRTADARMEIIAAYAARAGANQDLITMLLACISTDEAFDRLEQAELLQSVMQLVMERIQYHLRHRLGKMPFGVVVFTNERGILGKTTDADVICKQLGGLGEIK